METNELPPKKQRISPEMIIALSAVFVSVITMFVYIYQAKIMQEQQHTAVWPRIEWLISVHSEEGFSLSVQNKGVGPALIKETTLGYEGKIVAGPYELLRLFVSTDSLSLFTSTVNNRVLSPGEKVELFHIYLKNPEEYVTLQRKLRKLPEGLEYAICFCSIYDDCWTSTGIDVVESKCK